MSSNEPLSEQYRLAAKKWVEANEAASLMEETKSVVLSQIIVKLMEENLKLPVTRAEVLARSSSDYEEYITKMVKLRSAANHLKVEVDYLRMKHSEVQSHEATARAEMRL